MPLNWSAYEDIADFFTNDVKEIDGKAVFGHMDYGKKAPDLGWRFTDDWLGMAGEGDVGIPNGYPVDEWGIRMDGCRPVGSSVSRGGAANGPAAQFALRKYMEWLREYAPPGALGMDFYQSLPEPRQGQRRPADLLVLGLRRQHARAAKQGQQHGGRQRQAAVAHGADAARAVLEAGHEGRLPGRGLLDPAEERPARAHARPPGSTPSSSPRRRWTSRSPTSAGPSSARAPSRISRSTIRTAPKYGGLIQFFRGPGIKYWTPTGLNVPDYAKLAQLWWQNIGEAVAGEVTPETALNNLAEAQDKVMERIGASGMQGECGPKLNPEKDPDYWYKQPGAPWPKLANEKPQGKTMPYDQIMKEMLTASCRCQSSPPVTMI